MLSLRSRMMALSAVVATLFLLCTAQPGWAAENVDGVHNFGRVSDSLFRGAQPSEAGFSALHTMGVSIVVNFRDEKDEMAAEQHQVEAAGMKYIGIPWSGHDRPNDKQITQFLDLVRSNPQTKIFVHCKAGADRTGVMVAAYRIAVEHKSVPDAVAEMHQYHYHHFLLPHLERYVKSLPQLLQTEAVFSAYAPTAPATPATPAVVAAPAVIAAPATPATAPAAVTLSPASL
jgi:protein tyrosine/serine phosphatase